MRLVAVIGAGTMGHGIAQIAALAGYQTRLTDADPQVLGPAIERIKTNLAGGVTRGKIARAAADAALERIEAVDSLEAVAQEADLVIEAIVEDIEAKRSLFGTLDGLVGPHTVLATNTSSLSIAKIAEASKRPDRVLGMHFFNPVHIMKLLEIVVHDGTSEFTVELAREVAREMGKESILVRDRPGFASSRLGIALGLEAMRMVEEEVASAEDIDKAMQLGYGHPMGPLEVTDLVGLDVRLKIAEYLHRELNAAHFKPPAILRNKVDAGELGKKTGRGFYKWPKNKSS